METEKQRILNFWNSKCINLPSVEGLTAKREVSLEILLVAGFTTDEITSCMRLANSMKRLSDKSFRATFDWVIDQINFVTLYDILSKRKILFLKNGKRGKTPKNYA